MTGCECFLRDLPEETQRIEEGWGHDITSCVLVVFLNVQETEQSLQLQCLWVQVNVYMTAN